MTSRRIADVRLWVLPMLWSCTAQVIQTEEPDPPRLSRVDEVSWLAAELLACEDHDVAITCDGASSDCKAQAQGDCHDDLANGRAVVTCMTDRVHCKCNSAGTPWQVTGTCPEGCATPSCGVGSTVYTLQWLVQWEV